MKRVNPEDEALLHTCHMNFLTRPLIEQGRSSPRGTVKGMTLLAEKCLSNERRRSNGRTIRNRKPVKNAVGSRGNARERREVDAAAVRPRRASEKRLEQVSSRKGDWRTPKHILAGIERLNRAEKRMKSLGLAGNRGGEISQPSDCRTTDQPQTRETR